VKRLQMWTLNQMGLALNLDTATHGYVTMGREVTSLSFSILDLFILQLELLTS